MELSHGDALYICKNITSVGTHDEKLDAIRDVINAGYADFQMYAVNKKEMWNLVKYLIDEVDGKNSKDDDLNLKLATVKQQRQSSRNPRLY